MPVRPKADHKSTVSSDYPFLGLHDACITGNVGLAQYALTHGQPANAVLDGVYPIHVACAGGSELIVKLLVEHGADVNAARLPRKHSSDKTRGHIGDTGATPLHFAAANGHTGVVGLLLSLGAQPDRVDKRGVTPLQLAIEGGHTDIVNTLRAWEALRPASATTSPTTSRFPNSEFSSPSSSIPAARSATFLPPSPHRSKHRVPAHSPTDPDSFELFFDPAARRPSLPDISSPASTPGSSSSRPRSAGGSDTTPPENYERVGRGLRRLGSKYGPGLLSLFRRPSTDLLNLSGSPDAGYDSESDPEVGHILSGGASSPSLLPSPPPSAFQTTFLLEEITLPSPPPLVTPPPAPPPPPSVAARVFRPRQGSEVRQHSPLATEWRRPELLPDDDTAAPQSAPSPISPSRPRGSSLAQLMPPPVARTKKNGRPSTAGSRIETSGVHGRRRNSASSVSASGSSAAPSEQPPTPAHKSARSADYDSSPGLYDVGAFGFNARRELDRRELGAEFDLEFAADGDLDPNEERGETSPLPEQKKKMRLPDLRTVSSHAQAEALVERTREALLNVEPDEVGGVDLTAQLAAFGETLALEKRFRRGEAQRLAWADVGDDSDPDDRPALPRRPARGRYFVNRHAPPLVRTSPSSPSPKTSPGLLPPLDTDLQVVAITHTAPTPVGSVVNEPPSPIPPAVPEEILLSRIPPNPEEILLSRIHSRQGSTDEKGTLRGFRGLKQLFNKGK